MSEFDNEMTDEQLAALLRDVDTETDAEDVADVQSESVADTATDAVKQEEDGSADLSEADRKTLEELPTEDDVREQIRGLEGKWYVLHTYSGYEKRVKQDVETRIETMDMEDEIFQVEVPMEEVFEIRRGQRKLISRVRMPGYVLVRMHLNDDSWRVVQSTNGVTGFVGNGRNPVALREDEVVSMLTPVIQADAAATAKAAGKPVGGAEPVTISPFEVGDSVTLISEPWAGMPATVSEIDPANQRLTVLMTLVGQETPVELSFTQVRKED